MRRFRTAHKFSTRRVEIDGIKFQSLAEAERYKTLKLLEAAGQVVDIKPHPRFKIEHNDVKICTVVLDFQYFVKDSLGNFRICYEDVKFQRTKLVQTKKTGKLVNKITYTTDTRHSKIGRALLKAFFGIDVDLIFASK